MGGELNLPAAAPTVELLMLPLLFCRMGPPPLLGLSSRSTPRSSPAAPAPTHSISSPRATVCCWSILLRFCITARACSRCIRSAIFRRSFSASRLIRSASFFLYFSFSRGSCAATSRVGDMSRIDLLSVLVDCERLRVPRAVNSSTGGRCPLSPPNIPKPHLLFFVPKNLGLGWTG